MSQIAFYKKEINDSTKLESRLLFPISFQKKSKRLLFFFFFSFTFSEMLCIILELNTIPK